MKNTLYILLTLLTSNSWWVWILYLHPLILHPDDDLYTLIPLCLSTVWLAWTFCIVTDNWDSK